MITLKINHGQSQKIAEALFPRVLRAAVYYHTKVLEALNKPNSGVTVKGKRRYLSPSLPGEPPRKRTGWLQRNVLYEVNQKAGTVRVGVTQNAKYGLYLELGTRRMQARPWLLSTLRQLLPVLQVLMRSK